MNSKILVFVLCLAVVLCSIACNMSAAGPGGNPGQDNGTATQPATPGTIGANVSGGSKGDDSAKADATVSALLKADDYDRAIEEARAALDAAPSDSLREKLADAYMARAWYYKAKRLNPYTLKDLMSAEEAAPNYYRVYYDLGRFYNNQMQQSTGVLELNKCIKLKPDFAPAYNERSACESRIYRWEPALADADKAVQLNPEEALYYYTRSLAYRGLQKNKEAIADLEMVLKLSKDQALTDKANIDLKTLGK